MIFDTPAGSAPLPAHFSLQPLRAEKKLLGAAVFSVAVSALSSPPCAAFACLAAALFLALSGLPPAVALRRLLAVNAFFLILWLLLPLSFLPRSGEALFSLGPLAVYQSGLRLALLVTLKGNAIAAALLALAGSSTATENGHALLKLRVPEKLVALMLITHGNLSLIAGEYRSLFQAAKLRSFRPGSNAASYRTYARLIGLLLLRSWQRAARVDEAMRLRGFRGRFPLIPPRRACRPEVQKRNRLAGNALLALCVLIGAALLVSDKLIW